MSIANPLKGETNKRNDDVLAQKWSRPHDPKNRGDIDFTGDEGLTDQSFAKDADINNIVATFHKTGVFPEKGHELFLDISNAPSYQDAMQVVIDANNAFMALDAKTRKKFNNDPTEMLAFLDDAENREEAIKLGMIPAPAPTPQPASPNPAGGQPAPSKAKAKSRSEETDE